MDFSPEETTMPSAPKAEAAIIGGILLDPNAIERVKDTLPTVAFHFFIFRVIYNCALTLHAQGNPIDLMSVQTWLNEQNLFDKIGGSQTLVNLVSETVSAVNIDSLAELVNKKYRQRQIISIADEIRKLGYESATDQGVVLEEIRLRFEKITAISSGVITPKERLLAEIEKIQQLESPVDQHFAWEKLAKESGKTVKSLISLSLAVKSDEPLKVWSASEFAKRQLVETEWLVPGLFRMGTTSLLVAESKTGKSLLHYDWAYHVATGQGWGDFPATDPKKVLIVQTDEPEVDCQNRIIYRGLSKLSNIDIVTSFSVQQIARIRKEIANNRYHFIIIDSLTSINKFSGLSANDVEFSSFMYQLKDIASEFGCHILLIHHTNKSPNQAGLEKVAGSYGIPASVSDIFLLERRQGADQDDLERILKRLGSRSDGRTAWKLRLDLQDNSFEYLGHCDKNGDSDEKAEKEDQNKLKYKEQILTFLQTHAPTAYEAIEIAEQLKLNQDTTRKLVAQLSKGDAPLIASKRTTRANSRAYLYFYPSKQLDGQAEGDRLEDQPSNLDTAIVSEIASQQILEDKEEKNSENIVRAADDPEILRDSFTPKPGNFSPKQPADQLSQNPPNLAPVGDTATDPPQIDEGKVGELGLIVPLEPKPGPKPLAGETRSLSPYDESDPSENPILIAKVGSDQLMKALYAADKATLQEALAHCPKSHKLKLRLIQKYLANH